MSPFQTWNALKNFRKVAPNSFPVVPASGHSVRRRIGQLEVPLKGYRRIMGENIARTPVMPMLLIDSFTNKREREGGIDSNDQI